MGTGRSRHGAVPVHAVPHRALVRANRSSRRPGARPISRSIRTAARIRPGAAAARVGAGCGSRRPAAASGAPTNALAPNPKWKYLAGRFGINAAGTISIDPNDPSANTLWVGTGEGNTCGSGCVAGVGLYKSTDGGDHWSGPYGTSAFNARGVGTIRVKPGDPNTIYAGSAVRRARALVRVLLRRRHPVPGADPGRPAVGPLQVHRRRRALDVHPQRLPSPPTAARASPTIANNTTPCSPRGVRDIELDPSDPNIVYAASYARGVWRSNDSGDTWTQIKPSLNAAIGTTTARHRRHDAAERQDADVRRRGPHQRAPSTAGSSAATTSRPARRCSRT